MSARTALIRRARRAEEAARLERRRDRVRSVLEAAVRAVEPNPAPPQPTAPKPSEELQELRREVRALRTSLATMHESAPAEPDERARLLEDLEVRETRRRREDAEQLFGSLAIDSVIAEEAVLHGLDKRAQALVERHREHRPAAPGAHEILSAEMGIGAQPPRVADPRQAWLRRHRAVAARLGVLVARESPHRVARLLREERYPAPPDTEGWSAALVRDLAGLRQPALRGL